MKKILVGAPVCAAVAGVVYYLNDPNKFTDSDKLFMSCFKMNVYVDQGCVGTGPMTGTEPEREQ